MQLIKTMISIQFTSSGKGEFILNEVILGLCLQFSNALKMSLHNFAILCILSVLGIKSFTETKPCYQSVLILD